MIKKLLLGSLIISTAYVSGINAMQLNQNAVFNNTQNQNINTNNTINKLEKSITQLNNKYINEDFINRVIDFNNKNGNYNILRIYEYIDRVESSINQFKKNLKKKDHKSNLQKQDTNNLKLDDLQLKIQNVKNQTNTLIKNVGQKLDSEIEKLIVQVKNNYDINKNVFAKYSMKYTELNNYLQKLQNILPDTVYKNTYFKLRVLGNLINKLTVQIDNTKSNIKNNKNEYSNENKIQYGNKVRNNLIQKQNNKKYNNNALNDILFQNFNQALIKNTHNARQKLDSEIEKLTVQVNKDIKVLTDQKPDNYNIDKNTLNKYLIQYNELKTIVTNNKDKVNNRTPVKLQVLGNLIKTLETKLEVAKNIKPLTNTLFQNFDNDNKNNNSLQNTLFQNFNDNPINYNVLQNNNILSIGDEYLDKFFNNNSTFVSDDGSDIDYEYFYELFQDNQKSVSHNYSDNNNYRNNLLEQNESHFIIEENDGTNISTNENQLFDSMVEIKSNIHNENTNPNVITDNNIQQNNNNIFNESFNNISLIYSDTKNDIFKEDGNKSIIKQSTENNRENNINIDSVSVFDNSIEKDISPNKFNISNNTSLNHISTNNSSPYNKTNNNSIQNDKYKINNTNESIEMNSSFNYYGENDKKSNNNEKFEQNPFLNGTLDLEDEKNDNINNNKNPASNNTSSTKEEKK